MRIRLHRHIEFIRITSVLIVGAVFLGAVALPFQAAASQRQDAAAASIRDRMAELCATCQFHVQGEPIASRALLPAFYERRNFQPAWSNPAAINSLLATIDGIEADGLTASDYHDAAIRSLLMDVRASGSPNPTQIADLDLLLTDSLIRLAYHVLFGKVDPEALDSAWNMSREINQRDPVTVLQEAIDGENIEVAVEALKPTQPLYKGMQAALEQYRSIAAVGGWEQVPDGPTLKPGMSDARVVVLRTRLAATGDLTSADLSSPEFDEGVAQAVLAFQDRHGLERDNAVGPKTLAALNVPVEQRIDQIRVNLERARWVLHDVAEEFIVVNIAGYRVYYKKGAEFPYIARAQVGKTYRKTPVFKSEVKYLVLSPTWTVPPGILRKDKLPKIKQDIGYLRRHHLEVLTRDGKVVDPSSIDWSQYPQKGFPYILRQTPGTHNALGRIKFIFPNEYFVYLHDTPSKSLFDRRQRTFSSGCIRIQQPLDLAEVLLQDDPNWDRTKLEQALATNKTQTVYLPRPVPVLLLYLTAWNEDGHVHFREDVYRRDKAVLDELNGSFKFRKRPVLSSASL